MLTPATHFCFLSPFLARNTIIQSFFFFSPSLCRSLPDSFIIAGTSSTLALIERWTSLFGLNPSPCHLRKGGESWGESRTRSQRGRKADKREEKQIKWRMAAGSFTKELGALYRMHARETHALENSYGYNDVNVDTWSQTHFLKWVSKALHDNICFNIRGSEWIRGNQQ